MGRIRKTQGRRSTLQKAQTTAIGSEPTCSRNKENIPPVSQPRSTHPILQTAKITQVLTETRHQLAKTQRKLRHQKKANENLKEKLSVVKMKEAETQKKLAVSERLREGSQRDKLDLKVELLAVKESRRLLSIELMELRRIHREKIAAFKKRLQRADAVRKLAVQKAISKLSGKFKTMNGRTYSAESRKMLRMLVASGCPRSKAGQILSQLAAQLGVKTGKTASRRTVSRAVLEGYIAAKMQLGYEIGQTTGEFFSVHVNQSETDHLSTALTVSADSTSNRGVDFESRHIAMRVPDYQSGTLGVDPKSQPKIRLLCVDSTVEHTAEAAVNSFISRVEEALDFFNRSPQAQLLRKKVTIRTFMRLLKGMCGDHASKEKSAARGLADKKRDASIEDLGEDALLSLSVPDLVKYLSAWNQKKIAAAGGMDEWNKLSPLEQAQRDKALMNEITMALGKEEYDALPPDDRRELDLFMWAGCCMHKNENSFEGGNTEMKAAWLRLGVPGPIPLANKANAATLRGILNPGQRSNTEKLTEDEERAFEQTTCGGVKTTALAGTIFNHKDDKKGQGDRHNDYFKAKVDPDYKRFPDTSNTRFGSHGDAAADLIEHLDPHIDYISHVIRLSKQTASLTNIEHNVLEALKDPPTQTELCAMVLYSQAVSKPYMRAVRGPKSDNVLDLGPLHVLVRDFVKKVIENPELLVSEDATHVDGSLDGLKWDNPSAVAAVLKHVSTLPHLKAITVAFFQGALTTWERFSAEFAPGGLIDTASADEKHLAWMPATNDINEGALGSYRVTIRGKPTMTLHQYNAMAMYRHNDTQDFMDATFTYQDHLYIMREARRMDSSRIEATRRREIVDFRVEVARIKKGKEEARQAKLKADIERLAKVSLVTEVSGIAGLTVAQLGDQIDVFRFRGLPDVPAKSRTTKKADRQAAVEILVIRWHAFVLERGLPLSGIIELPSGPQTTICDDWEATEEAEMED